MKKLFATLACVALLSAGFSTVAMAQNADSTAAAAQVDSAAAPAEAVAAAPSEADATAPAEAQQVETSFHQSLKTKFIEGGADFMALVAITLVLGLAICLERIIYLNLANTNPDKLLKDIEDALIKEGKGYCS